MTQKYFPSGWLALLLLLVAACAKDDETVLPAPAAPNILLLIADDLGKDAIRGYSEGSVKPNTPHLDAIRNNGLTFTNFWVNPTCTPTRAAIITGKYGYRTGVKAVGDVLSPTELTLQKYLSDNTGDRYATAVIGKWHLSGNDASADPESFGIDHYAGLIRGAVDDYYQWRMTENGTGSVRTQYITEAFTDLALDWVNDQAKPWFLWLAYTAPHLPLHVPPADLHAQGELPPYDNGQDPIPYYLAAIEAMDDQIGRLLANLPEGDKDNTVVIFMGDNGTPNQVAQPPYTRTSVKNTLYQGGINVPLFVSGAGVSRIGTDDHLVAATDLFATISELAGIDLDQYQDSKSFASLLTTAEGSVRDYQYAEVAEGWAIGDGEYKLLLTTDGEEEMYHLAVDPYEQDNLLAGTLTAEAATAKSALENELAQIRR